ncbi:MAG: 2-succinyl-5-enolpyruvyl-6-hydroxy-3-cyclohexene-1-carboxylic-acid synthase [Micromonosporaceae bacterium]
MNPSTAFATVVVDELIRCGLREAVLAPGSRSAPLAMALFDRGPGGGVTRPRVRLHVRIDERSAAYLALGLAKASGVPAVVVCTSGTAAANFHPAVIEADEACVPLIVLTADRPPELRGTGANQAIDQVKLYGSAVRWFCEAGVPEARNGMAAYWRSLSCRAWACAAGAVGGLPGPVHINIGFAEPLVPDGDPGWCEPLEGRPDGAPWTRFASPTAPAGVPAGPAAVPAGPAGRPAGPAALDGRGPADLPRAVRGVVICGDGTPDPEGLVAAAQDAGWPVLAEPSSGARQGPNALSAYPYLLASPEFMAAHPPDVVVTAGKPGLSRQQLAFIRQARTHVAIAQGTGRFADPARSASLVLPPVRGRSGGRARDPRWLDAWLRADAAARAAADDILDSEALCEPRIARDLAAALPGGALLWAASSMPIRDLDHHMAPRGGLRVLASRGASGIDGLVSSAIGAALAHQAAGGGPAAALLGDLALLHDFGGLSLGPDEPRPDLAIVVVNNDGGGIFSLLEQAAFPGPFERVFGTPHGSDLAAAAAAVRVPYERLQGAADLAEALAPGMRRGSGLRLIEIRSARDAGTALRERLRRAAARAAAAHATGAAPVS